MYALCSGVQTFNLYYITILVIFTEALVILKLSQQQLVRIIDKPVLLHLPIYGLGESMLQLNICVWS